MTCPQLHCCSCPLSAELLFDDTPIAGGNDAKPASEFQLSYLNDLGYLPEETAGVSVAEASHMIERRADALRRFKASNNNKKWATGRQRKALMSRDINVAGDSITIDEANRMIDEAYEQRA